MNTLNSLNTDMDTALNFYLRDCFFLPQDILVHAKARGWMIPQIQVVDSEEFLQAAPLLESMTRIKYDPSYEIVLLSKRVGVSIRRHEASQQLHVIVKQWNISNASNMNKEDNHG